MRTMTARLEQTTSGNVQFLRTALSHLYHGERKGFTRLTC